MKGAWSSASGSVTPLPEDGGVTNNVFSNRYFGMTYALPPGWTEKYQGPPPSDSGRYVLAQIRPADTYKGPTRGSILITAQDMFFTQLPATNALELVNYANNNLQADYIAEQPPTEVKIAGHSFSFFAYASPVAQLHWDVLATQIRCHTVELVLTSRDAKLLQSLMLDMNQMKLLAEAGPTAGMGGGDVPVCIKDYAGDENVIERVDPVFTEHRFNPVPAALGQWKFRRYLRNGQPVEVETGIMFGRAPHPTTRPARNLATQ